MKINPNISIKMETQTETKTQTDVESEHQIINTEKNINCQEKHKIMKFCVVAQILIFILLIGIYTFVMLKNPLNLIK